MKTTTLEESLTEYQARKAAEYEAPSKPTRHEMNNVERYMKVQTAINNLNEVRRDVPHYPLMQHIIHQTMDGLLTCRDRLCEDASRDEAHANDEEK